MYPRFGTCSSSMLGEVYDQQRFKVYSVDQLNEGDHVVFDRGIYCHHAIVFEVRPDSEEVCIIHFDNEKSLLWW